MTTVGTLSTDLGPDDNKLERAPNGAGGFLQVTTKLDMEPNPFEQSFSGLSPEQQQAATAAAAVAAVAAATGGNIDATAGIASETSNKPVLPPIESMSGRIAVSGGSGGTDGDQYNNSSNGWDAQSLRMGPLSPSMLEGPQNPIVVVSSGATVSTADFTSGANGLVQQHHAPLPATVDNGFSFLTNAPTHGPQMMGGASLQTSEPYPPQIYNQAISQMHHQQQQQQPQGVSRSMQQHPQYAQHPNNGQLQERYMATSSNDGEYSSNLHLLSQATQRDMWIKRESMDAGHNHQQRLAHPQNGMSSMVGGPQQQQQQHLLQQQQQHQQPSKEGIDAGLARQAYKAGLESEDNNSDDSDRSRQSSEGAGSNNGKKRPASEDKMDDEEKRKNFLERNRQAALKCRQRKKQWLSNLQAKVEYLSTDNDHLQAQTASLRDEIIHLKALLLAHKDCAVAQANGVYSDNIRPQSGAAVPPPPYLSSSVAGTSQAQQNNQRNSMGGHRPPSQMQTGGGGGGGLAVGGHPNVHGQTQAGVRY